MWRVAGSSVLRTFVTTFLAVSGLGAFDPGTFALANIQWVTAVITASVAAGVALLGHVSRWSTREIRKRKQDRNESVTVAHSDAHDR